MVTHHKMVAGRLREPCRLLQVAKGAIGHEQPWTSDLLPHHRQQLLHEANIVGVAIRMGMQARRHTRSPIHGHQGASSQQSSRYPPQRLQTLGHLLNGLAVQNTRPEFLQTLGRRPFAGFREDSPQRPRALAQERLAHRHRQTRQLFVGRLHGTGQGVTLLAFLETAPATPPVAQQRVGNQLHHHREGQQLVVTPAPMPLPQTLQSRRAGDPAPQQQHPFRQGHPFQDRLRWSIHDRLLASSIFQHPSINMPTSKDLRNNNMFTAAAECVPD